MSAGLLGLIAIPARATPPWPGVAWCADNACYANYPGDDRYLAWLRRHASHAATCAFATAPDVVADATATLARSAPMLPRIRAAGYPAALVAQDGLEHHTIPWAGFDVLFLGSTDWKLSPAAAHLVREATERGLSVHMGRINSRRRLRYAASIGCQSADGTYLAYGPDRNLPTLLRWLAGLTRDPVEGRGQGQEHQPWPQELVHCGQSFGASASGHADHDTAARPAAPNTHPSPPHGETP